MDQDPTTHLNMLLSTNNDTQNHKDQFDTSNRKVDDMMSMLLEMKNRLPSVTTQQTASPTAPLANIPPPRNKSDEQYKAKLLELLDTTWPAGTNGGSTDSRYGFLLQAANALTIKINPVMSDVPEA
ncbi:hypothetical protein [Absidia glauca]|uniref:Uncharacterized protein n=1 Tax=Absidia glauca TaxID=4829 RepID=A0A163JD24_ABSGL|nr:hypothetical protein [Absidia glauca]